MENRTFVGIGSNLDNPRRQVEKAIEALNNLPESQLEKLSSLYITAPLGQPGQDHYINAVACLKTNLSAEALLDALQAIEHAQGRVRDGTRWGARTLDLDVLLYNDEIIDTERLLVPHPEMINRAFVLEPLADVVANDFCLPKFGALQTLRLQFDSSAVERIEV